MKLTRRSLILFTTLALSTLQAAPKPVSPTTTEAAKVVAKEKMDETHTLAVMDISFGGDTHQIIFELLAKGAPKTVGNFISNVDKGIYKGMAFHRAVDGYLVQTGDPASKDKNARERWGLTQEYTIPGEFKLPHEIGSVAMARRSDESNPEHKSDGTQFYFALGNMSNLNGQYTVFGKIVSGLDELKQLSNVVTDSNDCPLERAEISKIRIIEQKGPLVSLSSTKNKKGGTTRPESLKGPLEKILDRIW